VPDRIKEILPYHDAYGLPKFMKGKVDFVSKQMVNKIWILYRKDTLMYSAISSKPIQLRAFSI